MPLNRVDHLGFTVSNVDRSTEWYCEHLGFEPFFRYSNDEIGAEVQVLTHDELGTRLSLRRFDAGDTAPFSETRIGLDHIALQVEDEDDLARWHEQLEESGVACVRTDLPELSILVFRDPDNIQIELCTPMRPGRI
jgi:glyoxylase I family protein